MDHHRRGLGTTRVAHLAVSTVNPSRTVDGERITRSQALVLLNLAAGWAIGPAVSDTVAHLRHRGLVYRTHGGFLLTERGARIAQLIEERGRWW